MSHVHRHANPANCTIPHPSRSVLEPGRSLTLAEKGGAGAELVVAHPAFRIVATMNPGGSWLVKEGLVDEHCARTSHHMLAVCLGCMSGQYVGHATNEHPSPCQPACSPALPLPLSSPGGDYGKKELSPALSNRFTSIWVPAIEDGAELLAILESRLAGGWPEQPQTIWLQQLPSTWSGAWAGSAAEMGCLQVAACH